MTATYILDPARPLQLEELSPFLDGGSRLALSAAAADRVRQCRDYLDAKLSQSDGLYYGINTGFGALCNIRISTAETEALQHNLVRSHACGQGDRIPSPIVRLMLVLKIKSLVQGYSGVRLELVQRLLDFFNADLLPVVYELGSLGASGDLAPLAHLSLPVLGEGEVILKDEPMPARKALQRLGMAPLPLRSKEGLALLNGTQFSSAYAAWCVLQARYLWQLAHAAAALSLDAFDCNPAPFHPQLQRIRPHRGQQRSAALIRAWLKGSGLSHRKKPYVQDPYAFRCIPQVHGASGDALRHVESTVLREINAVTDNPNIFPQEDLILSGGNFHAQALALPLDYLSLALAELGSISERRTYQLLSGTRDLPAFLTPEAGLHSGLMIPQYTAAAMVSQNKQLCTPASVDSIVTSNGQEDHVSMAANAATRTYRIVQNAERILAIEWMTAAQAMEFRRPARTSPALEDLLSQYRKRIAPLHQDRILYTDIRDTAAFLRARSALQGVPLYREED